jgi:hypothetical protein
MRKTNLRVTEVPIPTADVEQGYPKWFPWVGVPFLILLFGGGGLFIILLMLSMMKYIGWY